MEWEDSGVAKAEVGVWAAEEKGDSLGSQSSAAAVASCLPPAHLALLHMAASQCSALLLCSAQL